jgi:hypothetical protein
MGASVAKGSAKTKAVAEGGVAPAGTARLGWLRRLGALGFAFFLVKGLLWLCVPALLAYFSTR